MTRETGPSMDCPSATTRPRKSESVRMPMGSPLGPTTRAALWRSSPIFLAVWRIVASASTTVVKRWQMSPTRAVKRRRSLLSR